MKVRHLLHLLLLLHDLQLLLIQCRVLVVLAKQLLMEGRAVHGLLHGGLHRGWH